ncbi:hypothetical protein E1176_17990, partial [Fulvivirga sp. RKSG066]|uniref:hypothetical protein n=1 Tax=Fulvivirga aurantia TaxID=2529383 RepID=UPI0012BCE12E
MKLITTLIFSLFSITAVAQGTFFVTFQSVDGKSNVVGASTFEGKFVRDLPRSTDRNLAWFKTSISNDGDATDLTESVIKPILGNPSQGHKVY